MTTLTNDTVSKLRGKIIFEHFKSPSYETEGRIVLFKEVGNVVNQQLTTPTLPIQNKHRYEDVRTTPPIVLDAQLHKHDTNYLLNCTKLPTQHHAISLWDYPVETVKVVQMWDSRLEHFEC